MHKSNIILVLYLISFNLLAQKLEINCIGKENFIINGRIPQTKTINLSGFVFEQATKKEKNFFINWDPFINYCDKNEGFCSCDFTDDKIVCNNRGDLSGKFLFELFLNRYDASLTGKFLVTKIDTEAKNSIVKRELFSIKGKCFKRMDTRLF